MKKAKTLLGRMSSSKSQDLDISEPINLVPPIGLNLELLPGPSSRRTDVVKKEKGGDDHFLLASINRMEGIEAELEGLKIMKSSTQYYLRAIVDEFYKRFKKQDMIISRLAKENERIRKAIGLKEPNPLVGPMNFTFDES